MDRIRMGGMRQADRGQRGFNLIEVIIAMALLSTVVLSIMTLFFFGRSNVYSGKQMTSAVAVATHVLEDLAPLTITQTGDALGFDLGTTAVVSNTVNGVTYASSILRSTDNVALDSDPPAFLDTWKAELSGGGAWKATTSYATNAVVAPPTANGFVYRATTAGTSGSAAPTWPTTLGNTVTDGGVTWRAVPGARLPDAAVDVIFTPVQTNTILKIRVIVSWKEGGRGTFGSPKRQIILDSVKVQRP